MMSQKIVDELPIKVERKHTEKDESQNNDKSEDDDGSRAVFDDVDRFRSQG